MNNMLLLLLLLLYLLNIVYSIGENELMKIITEEDMKTYFTSNFNKENIICSTTDKKKEENDIYKDSICSSIKLLGLGINSIDLIENILCDEIINIFYIQSIKNEYFDYYYETKRLKSSIYKLNSIMENNLTLIDKIKNNIEKCDIFIEKNNKLDDCIIDYTKIEKIGKKIINVLNNIRFRKIKTIFPFYILEGASITAINIKKYIFILLEILHLYISKKKN